MESLAHSLSKKSYGGTGFGSASHKSVYDDVFGGPPKFGVPTSLAPRFEDYGEIFGGFHTSRGLSIPVLDLPAVDEAELSFDVRSSWFDYSEVFGGFHDLDFAVSFEDLVRKFDSGDYSSDDAWSPDQTGSFSDELDPSVCSSNADSSYIAADVTKFHTSYYKANQRMSGEIAFGVTKDAHLSDNSGHGSCIDKSHASQKQVEPSLQVTGDCDSKIDCVGNFVERKQFRSSKPATTGSGSHESELYNLEKSNRSYAQSKPFVTINDISLRTMPSGIPPPSRPPPLFAVKTGASENTNSDLKDSSKYAFEQGEGSHSPPFYDVEVDVSSSKIASTTITSSLETDVNNTLEIAESKIKCVKQSIEKKEIPYCHIKPLDEDNAKLVGQRIRKTYCRTNSSMDDITQGTHATEGNGIHPPSEERNEETRVTEELPPVFDGDKCDNITEKPTESRDVGEYKLPPHLPDKFEGTFAWRQETEYFEVVETDLPSEAVVHDKYGYIFVPDRSDKYRQGKRAGIEASDLHNVEASKTARAAHDSNGEKNQLEWLQENHTSADHKRQPGATIEPSCVKDSQKKSSIDTDCYEEEVGGMKMKTGKQKGDMANLQNESYEIVENVVKAQMKDAENEARLNLWGTGERRNTDEIIMNIHEKKANGRRHWKSFETVNSLKISNKDVEQIVEEKLEVRWENRNKNQKQNHDKGESKKNPNKFCDGIDDGNIIEEATEKDYFGDGLKEANSYQGIEDKQKKTDEEENARDGKVYSKIEAKNRHSKVVLNLVKNENHNEMAPVEFYEEKLRDACDTRVVDDVNLSAVTREGWDENTIRFAFDKNYIEGSSRVTNPPPESMARNEDAFDHEVLGGPVEHIKWDDDYRILNLDQETHVFMKRSNLEVSDNVQEEMHVTLLPQKLDRGFRNLETTPESVSHAEDENFETVFQTSDQKLEEKASDFVVEEVSGKTQKDLQLDKLEDSTEDVIEAFCSNQPVNDSNQPGIDIGTSSTGHDIKAFPMSHDPGNVKLDNNGGQGEKLNSGVQFTVNQETSKNEPRSYQTSAQWTEDNKKTGVASSKMVVEKASELNAGQRFVNKNAEREERRANELLASEERKTELRLQKEREFEKEQLRKLEEEREREREREKDGMAIDSATFGNRGRSFADNLERAERPAVERATAELRQRAASTRERLEKDSLEVRERYLAEKASMEARLRVERSAVEKATAEARQRAFAKAMSEKPSSEVPERVERSVSDKFSSSSRMAEARQNSFSEPQKVPLQGAGTSSMLRYSYSSVNSGVEGESPQRYKSRLERYRRTAERAAKALAEKNMRDLLAQKELAERCRLAESLDVEIKRWSSGKEGNLRALLSTLQYILGSDSGWQPIPLTEVITTAAVKRAYRKATLCVHPDKLQQRRASIHQKYICEKVFDLLKEAWSTFNSEER